MPITFKFRGQGQKANAIKSGYLTTNGRMELILSNTHIISYEKQMGSRSSRSNDKVIVQLHLHRDILQTISRRELLLACTPIYHRQQNVNLAFR